MSAFIRNDGLIDIINEYNNINTDSIISFTFVLQLPDGTWSRDHVYNPKIDYKHKELRILIDWE